MESIFGMENMGKDATHTRIHQAYEKELLEIARISSMTRKIDSLSPVWYGLLIARFGDLLVSSGMRLKTHYSIQQAYRER
jgi:hypothetical protein